MILFLDHTMKNQDSTFANSTKIKFEDSDNDVSSSEDDEGGIPEELADVTFGELQRARSDGSETVYLKSNSEKTGRGRANKNRPVEMSSKKPVKRFREVIQAPKKVVRDPRFENLCGTLDVDGFKKRYNFLYDEQLPAEKEKLKKQLKKSKDAEAVNELKTRLAWIDKQLKSAATKNTEKEILAEHKKKEREAAKQGKQPYYPKQSDIRKQMLIEKYRKLQESGKFESFMQNKRKKNASKDHRYMPYRRATETLE